MSKTSILVIIIWWQTGYFINHLLFPKEAVFLFCSFLIPIFCLNNCRSDILVYKNQQQTYPSLLKDLFPETWNYTKKLKFSEKKTHVSGIHCLSENQWHFTSMLKSKQANLVSNLETKAKSYHTLLGVPWRS